MIELELDELTVTDRFFLRGCAFVSGDPGTTGGAVVWNNEGNPVWVGPIEDVAAIAGQAGNVVGRRCPVVLEAQYVTDARRARSVIRVAFLSGRFAEGLERELGCEIELYRVAPSTWQAAQRRRLFGKSTQAKRGEGIKLAKKEAQAAIGGWPEYKKLKAPVREGVASAYGIGRWWMGATE